VHITKQTIRGSPFVGVLAIATESVSIVPKGMEKKELNALGETLDVDAIQATIANSPLIGSLAKALGKKMVVPEIVERKEVEFLESQGLKVKTIDGIAALGNLIALNENGMLLSPSIEKRQQKEIERFFGIPAQSFTIAGSDLVGSGITCTKQGFIAHPKILQKEFNALKKLFCVSGKATSVNYGDAFVGNSVLANAYGALVGTNTTPSELLRIDEGLGG